MQSGHESTILCVSFAYLEHRFDSAQWGTVLICYEMVKRETQREGLRARELGEPKACGFRNMTCGGADSLRFGGAKQ